MARNLPLRALRTTKANLDTQASGNNLLLGEFYMITDQGGRLAIGTGTNSYVFVQTRGVSGYFGGVLTSNLIILSARAPYAFNLTQANCYVDAEVASTASTVLSIRNGGSEIGTATFAASGTVATIAISTPAVASGNKLTVRGPSSSDATLAGVTVLLTE